MTASGQTCCVCGRPRCVREPRSHASWPRPTALAALLAVLGTVPAIAQTASTPSATMRTEPTDFFTDLWTRQTMLGDMGGLRTALGNYGITLGLTDTSEVQGNTSGGLKQGGIYDGLTTLTVQ